MCTRTKKVEFITDSFIDYTGKERKFVMAAVSINLEDASPLTYDGIDYKASYCDKVVSVGVAVCRPNDEFNEELGKRIAEGKATKSRAHALYATDNGLINETVVKALLKQESEYFKGNPGRYLAGYNHDAEKYRESQRVENYIDSLDSVESDVLHYLAEASDEDFKSMMEAVTYVLNV